MVEEFISRFAKEQVQFHGSTDSLTKATKRNYPKKALHLHCAVIGSRKGRNPDDQLTNEKERSPQDKRSLLHRRDRVAKPT